MRRIASCALIALVVLGVTASGAGAEDKTPPGDPPGNNGTIKVVAGAADSDPGTEAQIEGCKVWVEFYGYDQGQIVDIAFNAQPPTGTGEELLVRHSEIISMDPAGGGQDKDDTLSFELGSALANFEASPQQGYHIKVTSNTQGAPGGAKQDVFWVKCTPEPPGTLTINKTMQGNGNGPFGLALLCSHAPLDQQFELNAGQNKTIANVPAGTTCEVTEPQASGATETWVKETPADGSKPDGKFKVGQGNMIIDLTNIFGAGVTRPPDVDVLGITVGAAGPQVIGDTLPRTGGAPWAAIALGSLGVATGVVVRRAGRRGAGRR